MVRGRKTEEKDLLVHQMITSTNTDLVKLPPLLIADMEKLDYLLLRMKERQTEFINIYGVCKEKWGDNRLLYLFFAEYLRRNDFTTVENHRNHREYVWKQMIAPRGLSTPSFKYEYIKQRKNKKKERQERSWYQDLASFLFT